MGEYEDRYPEAYGHEETEAEETAQHYRGFGLPRQVRSDRPAIAGAGRERPLVVNIQEPAPPAPADLLPSLRPVERPRRVLVERTPQEIANDVAEKLRDSPFIDASGVDIAVDGSQVTLSGTVNSLIAISLAQALASNVPGVGRVQVQLRVQPAAPRNYAPAARSA